MVSFIGGYRGRSAYRLNGLQTSFERLGIVLLDQIVVTVVAITLSSHIYWQLSSAYSRKLTQLCVSLGNISATIMFSSIKYIGIRQILTVAVTSVASISIDLRNAYEKESVSAEIAWLQGVTDQVVGDNPLREVLCIGFAWLSAVLLAVLLILDYRKRHGRAVELAGLIAGIPLILFRFAAIKDLYKKYEPYVSNDTIWSLGQVIPLTLNLVSILIMLGMLLYSFCLVGTTFTSNSNRLLECILDANTNAPPDEQHPKSKDGEDIPTNQNEVPWHFNIVIAIFFVREGAIVAILGVAGGCLGLLLIGQFCYRNRSTGKASSSYPCHYFSCLHC